MSATSFFSSGVKGVLLGGTLSGATLNGGTLEIASGGTVAGTIGFGSAGGTVKIDQAGTLGAMISGMTPTAGTLDFADIAFGAQTTLGFTEAPGNTSGTLRVSDGTHTATITLLGQYLAGNFKKASDGPGGGTLITDPPISSEQSLLVQPQHA